MSTLLLNNLNVAETKQATFQNMYNTGPCNGLFRDDISSGSRIAYYKSLIWDHILYIVSVETLQIKKDTVTYLTLIGGRRELGSPYCFACSRSCFTPMAEGFVELIE